MAASKSPPSAPPADTFGRRLGLEILELTPACVRARLEATPEHHQPYGILHGGVYCAVVEGVASYGAGAAARARGQLGVVGVHNATDFLRSHSRGELLAEGRPVHIGRSLQLWQVEIRRTSDGALVASGRVRFHVLTETPAERRARSRKPGAPKRTRSTRGS